MKLVFNLKSINALLLIIFTLTIFTLNFYTPLQADDYGYSLIGLDLEKHIHHYLTWSGRLTADFISPVILSIHSKVITSALQTSGVLVLIFLVSKFKDYSIKENLFIFSLTTIIFFLSHPSFGQANLWIVGSANYLWTSILYIFVVREVLWSLQGNKINFSVYPLSILAGCSNENSSVAVLCIIIISIAFSFFKNKSLDWRLLSVFVLTLIGAAFLLGSPGNESRMMDPSFAAWRGLSLIDKIHLHFFERMPDVFKESKLAYLASAFFIMISIHLNKFRLITDDKKPTNLSVSILLLMASIGCSIIMVFSPAFPDRAKTPAFIFCLMSIPYAIRSCFPKATYPRPLHIIYCIMSFVFIFEVLLVISAYHSIYIQNHMRLKLIGDSDKSSAETLIPEFYFKSLPSSTYKFETWTNFDAMAKYYNRNKIFAYGTVFDFSVIDDDAYKIHGTSDMSTKSGLKAIYRYSESYTLDTVFIFEVTYQEKLTSKENQRIFLRVKDINGNAHNYDFDPNYAYVNDRAFLYAKIKNMPYWFIKYSSFGVYDKNNSSIRYSQINF